MKQVRDSIWGWARGEYQVLRGLHIVPKPRHLDLRSNPWAAERRASIFEGLEQRACRAIRSNNIIYGSVQQSQGNVREAHMRPGRFW